MSDPDSPDDLERMWAAGLPPRPNHDIVPHDMDEEARLESALTGALTVAAAFGVWKVLDILTSWSLGPFLRLVWRILVSVS